MKKLQVGLYILTAGTNDKYVADQVDFWAIPPYSSLVYITRNEYIRRTGELPHRHVVT